MKPIDMNCALKNRPCALWNGEITEDIEAVLEGVEYSVDGNNLLLNNGGTVVGDLNYIVRELEGVVIYSISDFQAKYEVV